MVPLGIGMLSGAGAMRPPDSVAPSGSTYHWYWCERGLWSMEKFSGVPNVVNRLKNLKSGGQYEVEQESLPDYLKDRMVYLSKKSLGQICGGDMYQFVLKRTRYVAQPRLSEYFEGHWIPKDGKYTREMSEEIKDQVFYVSLFSVAPGEDAPDMFCLKKPKSISKVARAYNFFSRIPGAFPLILPKKLRNKLRTVQATHEIHFSFEEKKAKAIADVRDYAREEADRKFYEDWQK